MLDKLKKCGENKCYFKSKRIRDFDNAKGEGIGKINTKAIEFDKTKDKIHEEVRKGKKAWVIEFDKTKDKIHKGGDKPASVDALDIVCSKNKIIFIEFKGLCPEKEDFKEGLLNNLLKKVEGSIMTLKTIMKDCGVCETSSDFEKDFVLSYYFLEEILEDSEKIKLVELLILPGFRDEILNKSFKKFEPIRIKDFDEEYKKFRDQT